MASKNKGEHIIQSASTKNKARTTEEMQALLSKLAKNNAKNHSTDDPRYWKELSTTKTVGSNLIADWLKKFVKDYSTKPFGSNSADDELKAMVANKKAEAAQAAQDKINAILKQNPGASAKTNYGLSAADLQAMIAGSPNKYAQELLNRVANQSLVDAIVNGDYNQNAINRTSVADTAKQQGATTSLEEYLANAYLGAAADKNLNSAEADKQRTSLLLQLAKDPTLYSNLINTLRQSNATGLTAGSTAKALVDQAGTNDSITNAAKLYDTIKGLGDTDQKAVTQRLQDALEGFVEQQLGVGYTNAKQNEDVANNIATNLGMIQDALTAESAQTERKADDDLSRAKVNAQDVLSAINTQATNSQAASEAALTNYLQALTEATAVDTLTDSSGNPLSAEAKTALKNQYADIFGKLASQGSGSTAKRTNQTAADYMNENIYQTVKNSAVTNRLLNPDTYNSLVQGRQTNESLAKDLGIDFITDADRLTQFYQNILNEGNNAYDARLNDAQRAYVSAVAAGDNKTVQQLMRLANTASLGKKNVNATNVLTTQLNNQRSNSPTTLSTMQDIIAQRAKREADTATARQTALTKQNDWNNRQYTGLGTLAATNNNTSANIQAAYGNLMGTGMAKQTKFNDVTSYVNRANNERLSDAQSEINKINANNAASNAANNAAIDRAKREAALTAAKALAQVANTK